MRAALGYWMVQKFVIAEDGSVDVGIAQFVKWAMCVIVATFIFQSRSTITFGNSIYFANGNPWRGIGRANVRQNRAEFLSRDGCFTGNIVEHLKEIFWF
ncbi:unnamed protein product [Camellia sinensis]